MNRNEITMQLYTTRKFQPYEPIFKFLSDSGIENIELFDLDKIDLDKFKSMMDENGISIKSSHISFQAVTNTEETISRMKYLNIKHAIVPSVPENLLKILLQILILMKTLGITLVKISHHMYKRMKIMV